MVSAKPLHITKNIKGNTGNSCRTGTQFANKPLVWLIRLYALSWSKQKREQYWLLETLGNTILDGGNALIMIAQKMNYPVKSGEVFGGTGTIIMPPHPALSRKGRGNKVTPQQAARNH